MFIISHILHSASQMRPRGLWDWTNRSKHIIANRLQPVPVLAGLLRNSLNQNRLYALQILLETMIIIVGGGGQADGV